MKPVTRVNKKQEHKTTPLNTSLLLPFLVAPTFSMAAVPAAEKALPWSRSVFRNGVDGERSGSVWQTWASLFQRWGLATDLTGEARQPAQTPQHVRAGQRMRRVCVCACVHIRQRKGIYLRAGASSKVCQTAQPACPACVCVHYKSSN